MNSNNNLYINKKTEDQVTQEEIDLKRLFDMFWRNKRLIGLLGSFGVIISSVVAFNTKKVWQGEFQIVLEIPQAKPSLDPSASALAGIVGLSSQVNTLETEVGILKSPSVLINVFEFVKTQKALKSNASLQSIRFKSWQKNSLDIELEKGTSILNLAYRDVDKDLILPVLDRISTTYQEFSQKKRTRSLDLGLDYFKEQISLYRNKSIGSLRKAQQFAIDKNLSILQEESTIDLEIPNSINVESIRVKAANKIRLLDLQLEQMENLKFESDQIMYAASSIPDIAELKISQSIKDIDSKLAYLRVVYKENDKTIQKLVQERMILFDLLKKQVKGYFMAQKLEAQALLKAAERPEGVVIEYKRLLANALKDKSTLDDLENQNRALLLQKARSEDPWKLITNPTLIPSPVAPNKKQTLVFGLLSGILLGSIVALINEKIKNIIYSVSEQEPLCKWPLLVELSASQTKAWAESLDLLISGELLDNNGSIALVPIGDINESLLKELSQVFKQLLEDQDLIVTKNLIEARKCTNVILLTAFGITKREELIDTNKKLLLQSKPVVGLVSIKNINFKT